METPCLLGATCRCPWRTCCRGWLRSRPPPTRRAWPPGPSRCAALHALPGSRPQQLNSRPAPVLLGRA
eukprot:2428409-Lingulodinium_polyedra.AAC.1